MRPITTDWVAWSACVCVCVCICGHVREPCKNGWTDRDAVWRLSGMGPRNNVLDGIQISQGKGQFWGVYRPIKKHWVTSALNAAKINNASQRHCCSALQCCRLAGVTLHIVNLWKNSTPAMRPIVEILLTVVNYWQNNKAVAASVLHGRINAWLRLTISK